MQESMLSRASNSMMRFRRTSFVIAWAALSAVLLSSSRAQEQQPRSSDESAIQLSVEKRDLHGGHGSTTAMERAALDAAKTEIQRTLSTIAHIPSETRALEALAVNRKPSGKYELIVKYQIDWIEWSVSSDLPAEESDLVANAVRAVSHIDDFPLRSRVISRSDAELRLRVCDSHMAPVVRALVPPYYNQPTNVRWDARAGAPILRSITKLAANGNDCMRADLNLITGAVMCREVACATR